MKHDFEDEYDWGNFNDDLDRQFNKTMAVLAVLGVVCVVCIVFGLGWLL